MMGRGLAVAFFASALVGCPPTTPPFVPTDTTRIDAGRDAPEVEDGGMDAPAADTGSDASVDTGEDALPDVPPDTSCVMRADCDSTAGCETMLGTLTHCTGCGDACSDAHTTEIATCDIVTGCAYACRAGLDDCDGIDGNGCEINTDTNVDHCGGCGMGCGAPPEGGNVTCLGGDCIRACGFGTGDCDGDLALPTGTGCEINTNESEEHCGGCRRPCSLPTDAVHAAAMCMSGTCRQVCEPGYNNCDSSTANGCETMGPC